MSAETVDRTETAWGRGQLGCPRCDARQWTKNLLVFGGHRLRGEAGRPGGDGSRQSPVSSRTARPRARRTSSTTCATSRPTGAPGQAVSARSRAASSSPRTPLTGSPFALLASFSFAHRRGARARVPRAATRSCSWLCRSPTRTRAQTRRARRRALRSPALFVVRASAGAVGGGCTDLALAPTSAPACSRCFLALGKRRAELVLVEFARNPRTSCPRRVHAAADRPAREHRRLGHDRRLRPVHIHRAGFGHVDGHDPVRRLRHLPVPVAAPPPEPGGGAGAGARARTCRCSEPSARGWSPALRWWCSTDACVSTLARDRGRRGAIRDSDRIERDAGRTS